MNELRDLVRVISRRRIKKISLINDDRQKDTLYFQLFQGIKSGRFRTDEEAAQALFHSSPDSKTYLMAKSRVRNRILNQFFFLENKGNEYSRATYLCNREWFAGKFLVQYGAVRTGKSLLKSALRKAERYGFHDTSVQVLRILKNLAAFEGNEKEFQKYKDVLNSEILLFESEITIEGLYQEVSLMLVKSAGVSEAVKELAAKNSEKAAAIHANHPTLENQLNVFRLELYRDSLAQDFEQVIETARKGQEFLAENPQISFPARLGEMALFKMEAALALGDFVRGVAFAEECEKCFLRGSMNWYIFREYYFLLAIQTGNYQAARAIYQEVTESEGFSKIDAVRNEKWRLFGAFLEYVLPEEGENKNAFHLHRFLNEVPVFSRDKKGLNVAILAIQFLFLIRRKDYDRISRLTDSFKIYNSRYLKGPDNRRTNLFFRLLLLTEKKGFDAEELKKAGKKLFSELKKTRNDFDNSQPMMEILPYESLWSLMLNDLSGVQV